PPSIAASRCAVNSSSISRFSRSWRKTLLKRLIHDIAVSSCEFQDALYGVRDRCPTSLFTGELFFASRGQIVNAQATAGALGEPLGPNQAGLFHTMQGRVE